MDTNGWALTLVATAVVFGVCTWFVFHYPSQQYRYTAGGLVVGAIFFLVTNPVVEEIFWRAFVQDILADWIGFWPALLLTSLVFGLPPLVRRIWASLHHPGDGRRTRVRPAL